MEESSQGLVLTGGGTLQGTEDDDWLQANAYGAWLVGGGGNDHLEALVDGGIFDVVFEGGAGNDVITGSYARDVYRFDIGDGHDLVRDSVMAHPSPEVWAYFERNSWAETYQDRVEFGAGIREEDVAARRDGSALVVEIAGGAASLTFAEWFAGGIANKIERFTFADGTEWLGADMERLAGEQPWGLSLIGGGTLAGSQYDDDLLGNAYGTHLLGGPGNDTLRAEADGGVFDLVFEGGPGNDLLVGSYARDVYRFQRGDGHDEIQDRVSALGDSAVRAYFNAHPDAPTYQDRLEFGAGILPSHVTARKDAADLVLEIDGGADSIRLPLWFLDPYDWKIEEFAFADGTVWRPQDLHAMVGEEPDGWYREGSGMLQGTPYGDSLQATGNGTHLLGGAGHDRLAAVADGAVFGLVFEGGPGNDLQVGSYAGDTYRFNLGDGWDTIADDVRSLGHAGVNDYFLQHSEDPAYHDRLEFGPGITPEMVEVLRGWGGSLVLSLLPYRQGVEISDWFDGTIFSRIESFHFADGTVWTAADVQRPLLQPGDGGGGGVNITGEGMLRGTIYDDGFGVLQYGSQVIGGEGNDFAYIAVVGSGGVFDVEFDMGRGDDDVSGSYARDFYRYDLGDGHDTIRDDVRALGSQGVLDYFLAHPEAETYQDHLLFGAGIAPADVTASRNGNDMVFAIAGGGSITVQDWFDDTPFCRIEVIGFADGTTWAGASLAG